MDAQKEINGSVANKKPKTPAQLEKERAKAEKVAKFLEKQKKLEEKSSASQTTEKSKSEKKQDVVEYNGSTKAGEKKGIFIGKHSL
jgi:valyl-tRNA synthetase